MGCALKTPKLYTSFLYTFVMNFAISNSTAIEAIAINDNTATLTFVGNRSYDYTLNDVANFVTNLSKVIESGESVGRFVNNSIKSEVLMPITA